MPTLKQFTQKMNQSNITRKPQLRSSSRIASNIQDNSLEAVNILIKRFLKDLTKDGSSVKIHDTKELKDVVTVFQELKEINSGNHQNTPEINTDAINFISSNLKVPQNSKDATLGVNKKLKTLDSKQIKQLMSNQETDLNKQNVKQM